ncbi:hypothetical protein [Rhodococcus erythropolis]|uniref:Uncharacterized protein n=1 Tax=Rhodococcus erythropolis TaxID=1833 RepID=A0A8I1A1E3_RHOER|nr:hypothetical protein [Rhodococcus erythropolis]MBH5144290.1 hypothetical protein [Rhodococcus erythropolis]QEM25686.1 hypothetical protein D6M20_02255 [Rhodococcus qingshengii]
MTKNSGQKKAARKYQQEHPGTTLPEAMRAVARPTAEPFSMPDGYLLVDHEGMPTSFDPWEATPTVLMENAGAAAVPTLSDQEAASRSARTIESLIELLGARLDAQDRGMLRQATSAVRAEGPQDNGHRWGKSTLNPDFRSLLFRDINNNGPVELPVGLPSGGMVPESMKGLPAVAAAAFEPTPSEYRTDEPRSAEFTDAERQRIRSWSDREGPGSPGPE